MDAHVAELAEGVHELRSPVALELLLEEVDVDEHVGQRVFVHEGGVISRHEVLRKISVWDSGDMMS